MNPHYANTHFPLSHERHPEADTRLRGRGLVLVWILWGTIALFALLVYLFSLPAYYTQLHTVCTTGVCVPGQLSPAGAQALYRMSFSLSLYAATGIGLNIATALVWFSIAAVLFSRQSSDRMALLVALALVLVGATVPPDQSAPSWQWPLRCVDFLAVVLLFLVFSLFPNGRFVPGWMCWLPVVYIVLNLADLFPNLLFALPSWLNQLYLLLTFGCIGLLGMTQIYRYRRMSNAIERQQIKWVVFSCAVVISGEFVLWLLVLIFPSFGQVASLYDLYFNPVSIILILLIPLSLGIAILRYRLWDIDVLINRTLVYATLTVLLALLYFGLVIGLESLVHLITGQVSQSPVIIVASTLAIAALFHPLRRRIQRVIDRRFYRHKYDAVKTLEAFSATLRNELDLNQLSEHLLAVVQDTMQPTYVSLWLRTPKPSRRQSTQLLPRIEQEERQRP